MHFDDPKRGFSFQNDGPLDMRFDTNQSLTASEIINGWTEYKLAEILWKFGEIRSSRKIAKLIVSARKQKKITTTAEFAKIIESKSLMPQIFQALRIVVNDELNALKDSLQTAAEALKSRGKLAIISFHSLEDRIVKNFFRQESRDCMCSASEIICKCRHIALLKVLTKKPIRPNSLEIQNNPRSRSAKLRVAEKV